MDTHDQSLEEIFNTILALPTPEERRHYLDQVCGQNESLKRRIEALLRSHDDSSGMLNRGLEESGDFGVHAGDVIGNYRLLGVLGEGGFGAVFRAEQSHPIRREVALKLLKPGMGTKEVLGRFEAERQALALMDHPCIAKVFDAGATGGGRPYFVMELVHGSPVTHYCDAARLDTCDRLKLFTEICGAVQHAHQKGVIHRDIKPSNVLVDSRSERPAPKVIDFGIAKATQQPLSENTVETRVHQLIGTPAYMSPEQAIGGGMNVDTRTDIYSLGILLYELLTGRTPFDLTNAESSSYDDLRRTIGEKDPPKPSTRLTTLKAEELGAVEANRGMSSGELADFLKGELDWIVLKALEKDRNRRYDSAAAFAEDIQRFLRNEPVTAVAPSPGYRLRKFAQRNRMALAGVVGVSAALILGTVASLWQASVAKREKSRAVVAELQTKQVFSRSDLQVGVQLLERGSAAEGVAHLVRALRTDPENEVAAARLLGALVEGRFLAPPITLQLPQSEPVHDQPGGDLRAFPAVSPSASLVAMARSEEVHLFNGTNGLPVGEALHAGGRVSSLAITADDRHLIIGTAGGRVEIRDLATRTSTGRAISVGAFPVTSLHVSEDGRMLVTVSNESPRPVPSYSISAWDFSTGELLDGPLREQTVHNTLHFSHDGNWLALPWHESAVNGFLVWRPRERSWRTVNIGARVMDLAIAPGDSRLVTASEDRLIRVWDTTTWKTVATHDGHSDAVGRIRIHPAGNRIVSSSGDGTVRVLDLESAKELLPPLLHGISAQTESQSADAQPIMNVAGISPDGMRVATTTGSELRVWCLFTGSLLSGPAETSGVLVSNGDFSPDGKRLILSGAGIVDIWNMAVPSALPTRLQPQGYVSAQTMSRDGTMIATALADRTVRLWSPATQKDLARALEHPANVSLLALSEDGSTLASVANTSVYVWDVKTATRRAVLPHDGVIRGLKMSRAGERVAVWTMDFTLQKRRAITHWHLWDGARGTLIHSEESSGNQNQGPMLSDDGRVAVVRETGVVTAIHFSGVETTRIPLAHPVVGLSADGTMAAVEAGNDGHGVDIIDTRTGRSLGSQIAARGGVEHALFTPDGSRLVVRGYDRRVSVYDRFTGRMVGRSIRLGEHGVLEDVGPDGRYLLTSEPSAFGRSSRVWDLATGMAATAEIPGGCQQFVNGGRWLVSSFPELRLHDFPSVGLRLPEWFLDFAEAWVGQQFSEDGELERVPGADRIRIQSEAAKHSSSEGLGRWVRWLVSPPEGRSNSPHSPVTIDDLVENLKPWAHSHAKDEWAGLLLSSRRHVLESTNTLRRLLAAHPAHPIAMAEFGLQLGRAGARAAEEADWYTRRATELTPASAATWLRRAQFLREVGRFEDALNAVESGLRADNLHPQLWHLSGLIQLDQGNPANAVTALSEALRRCEAGEGSHDFVRCQVLESRSRAFKVLGREAEAREDLLAAKGIGPRPADLGSEFVDLSAHYNASLDEGHLPILTGRIFGPQDFELVGGNDLSPVPRGRQMLNDVAFDIRGMVQLSSSVLDQLSPGKWPEAATKIALRQPAGRIHFLLGVGASGRMKEDNSPLSHFDRIAGTAPRLLPRHSEVARLHIHYADGSTREVPVRLDKEVRDIRLVHKDAAEAPPFFPGAGGPKPDWTGVNPAGVRLALSRFTWDNPLPRTPIDSFDLISAMTEAAPFLIAVTAEPLTSYIHDLSAHVGRLLDQASADSVALAWELAPEQVSARIDEELRREPENPLTWVREGYRHLHLKNWDLALQGLTRALELGDRHTDDGAWKSAARNHRNGVFLRLGRADEAARENCRSLGIPLRPENASPSQIDLSLYYNGALSDSWMMPPDAPIRNDLSGLKPYGLKEMGGVIFDVRGVIQLANLQMAQIDLFPSRVEAIQVGLECQRLHFLHAAGWGNGPPGTPVSTCVVHYEDGQMERIPFRIGDELWDWFDYVDDPIDPATTRNSEIAWTGENEMAAQFRARLILFKTTWPNPRPNAKIRAVDLVSEVGMAAPFVVAISAD